MIKQPSSGNSSDFEVHGDTDSETEIQKPSKDVKHTTDKLQQSSEIGYGASEDTLEKQDTKQVSNQNSFPISKPESSVMTGEDSNQHQ